MKFRKLTGILVALSMIASYSAVTTISVGADTIGSSGNTDPIPSVTADPSEIGSLFPDGLEAYLRSYFFDSSTSSTVFRQEIGLITMDPVTGAFPVNVSADSLRVLRAYHRSGYTVELTFKICDPVTGTIYYAKITADDAGDLSDSELTIIENNGGLSLALSFAMGNEVLEIKTYNILYPDSIEYPVTYKIARAMFGSLVIGSNLSSGSVVDDDNLGMYAIGSNELLRKEVDPDFDLDFVVDEQNRKGIYLKRLANPEHYYTKSEAEPLIRDYIYEFLGFGDDGLIKGIDSEFENTKKYIENTAIPSIKAKLERLSVYSDIKTAVDEYCYDNKAEFIDEFVSDIDMEEKIEDVIDEVLGDDITSDGEKALYDYIYKKVMDEVTEQLDTYNTPINDKIAEVVEDALNAKLKEVKSDVIASLMNDKDFLASIKGDKGDKGDTGEAGTDGENGLSAYEIAVKNGFKGTISEWLESLYGKDGAAGEDGESFEKWMIRNYGSQENFMNQISFEGWAKKNYGSVDNFIKTVTKENGLSAYELAVQNGYKGTLTQWLDSLKGEDGLSAYEVAVKNGFKGDEDEWLESLKGEDGEDGQDGEDGRDGIDGIDGQDGRDGQDGQIIYVNGTYGQVTDDYTDTEADVVLVPTPSKPSAGNVNPSTGVAAGIIIPSAIVGSVLLLKKDKRKRGRK